MNLAAAAVYRERRTPVILMVVVPVGSRAAHAVFGRLDLVGKDRHDAAPVAPVPECRIDISLNGDDVADLTDKEPPGVGSRAAVFHLQPAGIRALQEAKTALLSLRLELSQAHQKELNEVRIEKDKKIEALQNELLKAFDKK